MLNLHITLYMVLAGFESIVERFGADHTPAVGGDGAGCVYMKDGDYEGHVTPICLVGMFFSDLGILRLLTDKYGGGDSIAGGMCNLANFGDGIVEHLSNFGVSVDNDARDFLRAAQTRQDKGASWGDAFAQTVDEFLLDRGLPTTPLAALRASL